MIWRGYYYMKLKIEDKYTWTYVVMGLMLICSITLSTFNATCKEGEALVKYTVINLLIIDVFFLLRVAGFDNWANRFESTMGAQCLSKYWYTVNYSRFCLLFN